MLNKRIRHPHKNKSKKSLFRRISDWLHLWLGISSGLIIIIVALTGCIYAFQVEISQWLYKDQIFIQANPSAKTLPLSQLVQKAEQALGGQKKVNFLTTYRDPSRAWEFYTYKPGDEKALTYFGTIDYFDLVFMDPHSGKVTGIQDGKYNFFNIVKYLHWSLLLNDKYGQQIVGWATFIFVIILITGLIHWWPKKWNKTNRDKSFKVKWKAGFKRLNYDLHNVPGFYAMLISLVLALSGMVWAFQWFQNTVYVIASGSFSPPANDSFKSDSTKTISANPFDVAFEQAKQAMPKADRIGMSPASGAEGVIYANGYQGKEVFYRTDGLQFDRYTGKLLHRKNYEDKNGGEKLISMNYDIHVGAILGLPGKIMAFSASLIIATLPVTGFIIWWGKRKKKKKPSPVL
ncbi:PepSY-associated TM helix domain-containing protein [Pedobacter nutrimenti]|jgi:uncharacterized iron-regulated membrane protein|uniref:Putative iron-regulated membrane protein n=1 Tax=Pedobacter nutrimenti TaxID=1241337 RepID=A0A318U7A2_9SPHI|nr:PepSY-associated TM helix domain-containing protein [Pedobacter nutrimenti]PYF69522.1 putative iron-regulated membrane protein [Pedobacter nutrimenti]